MVALLESKNYTLYWSKIIAAPYKADMYIRQPKQPVYSVHVYYTKLSRN